MGTESKLNLEDRWVAVCLVDMLAVFGLGAQFRGDCYILGLLFLLSSQPALFPALPSFFPQDLIWGFNSKLQNLKLSS